MKNSRLSFQSFINIYIVSFLIMLVCTSCKEPPFPRIDSIEPARGHVGDFVRIKGANLEYRNSFYFGDYLVPLDSISGSSKEMNFRVPNGFNSGAVEIYIVTEEEVSNSVTFTILPSILNLSPNSAAIGEEIMVETNFDIDNLEVIFSENVPATSFSKVDAYTLKVTVPEGATSGSIEFKKSGVEPIIIPNFIVQKAPSISQIEPSWGWPGREITISGRNFLDGVTNIQFASGKQADITSISFNQIKVLVPQNAENGLVWVENPYGRDSVEFVVSTASTEAPFVSQIIPTKISPGCEITVIGGNYDPDNTSISFEGKNGRTTMDVKPSEISDPRNKIILSVPPEAIAGDITISTLKGISDPVFMEIVDLPYLKRVFPEKNDLGGQVILDLDNSQSVSRLFFGDQPVTDANGAFERYIFSETGNEIIATNVPLNFTSPQTQIFLEVSEGCYSNSLNFQVETNKTAPNAPIAGGPHTVIIPAATAGLSNINNDWTVVSGDFNDPQSLSAKIESFFLCGCYDPDGNVLLFDFFGNCDDTAVPSCSGNPQFLGRDEVGIIRIDGTVDIYGKWYGRIQDKYSEYGAKGMILTSVEYGDQLEFTIPDFIYDPAPNLDVTIGDSLIIEGRFESGSNLYFSYKKTPFRYISPGQIKIEIPKDLEDYYAEIYTKYFDGQFSNTIEIDINYPDIITLTPDEGPPGTVVILEGEFSTGPPNDRFKLIIEDHAVGNTYNPSYEELGPGKIKFTIPTDITKDEHAEILIKYYNNYFYRDSKDFYIKP